MGIRKQQITNDGLIKKKCEKDKDDKSTKQ
jgi:hypothetical protein